MTKHIIEFERFFTLRKVMKIPDGRYKSGYRTKTVLAENYVVIPDNIDGTDITQSHIRKHGNTMVKTDAFVHLSCPLQKWEQVL